MLQKSSALKDFLCQCSSEVSREKSVQQSYLRIDFAPHYLFIYFINFFAPLRMALPILRSRPCLVRGIPVARAIFCLDYSFTQKEQGRLAVVRTQH